MDRLTKLLQESYQTPRELHPPAGAWDRLAQDLSQAKRRRRAIWWWLGSVFLFGSSLLLFRAQTPTLSAFPIPAQLPLVAQQANETNDIITTEDHNKLERATSDVAPVPSRRTSKVPVTPMDQDFPTKTQATLANTQTAVSFENATLESPAISSQSIANSDGAREPTTPSIASPLVVDAAAAPASSLPLDTLETSIPDVNMPVLQVDNSKGQMEEVLLPDPPRENVWRLYAGTQQRMDGVVLMTYTDYPLLRGQAPLRSVEDTDLYRLTFARGRKRTNYLEVGAALQRYHNERLSFNYQLTFFSGTFTSEVLEPYVRVNTEHYQETGTTKIRALQAEYGVAWDWLRSPRLRLAPYAGLLYQLTVQSEYQSTLRLSGLDMDFATEDLVNPPHVTDEFRLRIGGLAHLPLQQGWELSLASGFTTEFLERPRPMFYGNVGIARAF